MPAGALIVVDRISFGRPKLPPNRLICGDNLRVLGELDSDAIDLVYADPPFFSGRERRAAAEADNAGRSFSDIWEGGLPDYLGWLGPRLCAMKRVIKKAGSIYVHCDWHASHYIKVEMDKIFGYERFVNEIVWHYESGGRASGFYSRKHDVLLWYARGRKFDFFPDAVALPRNRCPQCGSQLKRWNNLKREVDDDGRVYRTIKSAGRVYKYYDDEPAVPCDTWTGISHLQQKDPERLRYPTQKPERLLERVIRGVTTEGGLVADFFCGSGTTLAVAQRLGRRWIGCDESAEAVKLTAERLRRLGKKRLADGAATPDFTVEQWTPCRKHDSC